MGPDDLMPLFTASVSSHVCQGYIVERTLARFCLVSNTRSDADDALLRCLALPVGLASVAPELCRGASGDPGEIMWGRV